MVPFENYAGSGDYDFGKKFGCVWINMAFHGNLTFSE